MPSPNDIVAQMRQALAVSEPDLDTSIGTPIRKVLDVVSEAIAEAYLDRYLLSYQYDIDSRSGSDLDAFVGLFGFARLAARRASGTILLQRNTPAEASIFIPAGSQVATADSPAVVAQIVSSSVFPQGATSISVSVQAVIGGNDGNVSANTLVRWINPISGIVAVTNPAPLTGGMDAENDAQLRERFRRSVFRSLAGTEDMYLGICLDDSDVSAAKILGPAERWREQIELVSGTATSTISTNVVTLTVTAATNASPSVLTTNKVHNLFPGDIVKIAGAVGNTAINGTLRVATTPSTTTLTLASLDGSATINGNGVYTASSGSMTVIDRCKWVYDTGAVFGADIDNGKILTPGVHYTLDTTTIPPKVTSLDSVNCPDGLYDLTFNYVPIASRNDPPRGLSNRVDLYLNGRRVRTATETALCDGRVTVAATPGSATSYNRFNRLDGSFPTSGNVLMRLSFSPVVDIPDSLSIGGQSLIYGTDYWLVNEIGGNVGAWNSFAAVEIASASVQAGSVNIASSTNASPIVVTTSTTHAFKVGQTVTISAHTTNTAANGTWVVSAISSNTLTLSGSTGNGVGGATGTVSLLTPTLIGYDYNAVPRDVQVATESWRLLTTDVVTHYAIPVALKINAAVILRPGVSASSVQAAINNAVSRFLATISFGGVMQVSDLLNVIGDVTGVDAVRLLNSGDRTFRAISGATNATPIVLTLPSGHGFSANDLIVVSGVAGNTAANGTFVVQSAGSTTVTLKNSVGNGAYTSGGTAVKGDIAIQRMEQDGTTPRTVYLTSSVPYRATDIQIADNEFFTLHSVVLTVKAANTWGTV